MKRVVFDRIREHFYGNDFNLIFNSDIILLRGDSGTGKSYMKERLKSLSSDKLIVYDYIYLNRQDDMFKEIKSKSGVLFVIDDADILLTDEMRKHIAADKNNQYLIIGRDSRLLCLSPIFFKELVFNDNVFSFGEHNTKLYYALSAY